MTGLALNLFASSVAHSVGADLLDGSTLLMLYTVFKNKTKQNTYELQPNNTHDKMGKSQKTLFFFK